MGFRLWRIERCDCNLCQVTGNTRIRGWSALDYKAMLLPTKSGERDARFDEQHRGNVLDKSVELDSSVFQQGRSDGPRQTLEEVRLDVLGVGEFSAVQQSA